METRLERLPPSVTGLFDSRSPFRSVAPKAFKGACHLVAQMEGASVEAFRFDLLLRSCYSARLITRSENVAVLCNAASPYLAFSPSREEAMWRDRVFIAPVFQAAFETLTSFQPLDADRLMSDVDEDLLADLPAPEAKQVRHWEPSRIGTMILNEWD